MTFWYKGYKYPKSTSQVNTAFMYETFQSLWRELFETYVCGPIDLGLTEQLWLEKACLPRTL